MVHFKAFTMTGMVGALLFATLGCESKTDPSQPESSTGATESPLTDDVLASLSQEDRALAAAQQGLCPVSGEPLGSMGPPVKVTVEGRDAFVCCEGCIDELKNNFAKYKEKLPEA